MRTPVRLAAALLKFRAAAPFKKNGASPIFRWVLRLGPGRLVPSSRPTPSAKAAAAQRKKARRDAPWAKSPIVWLTGASELLEQSIPPGLARMMQESGRTVFFETDGLQLRRRIHEFHPDSRLYLTIRLYGMPETHDARIQQPAAFARAVEGIRAAQLSGFLICAHIVLDSATQPEEIDRLLKYLQTLHIDGLIITSGEDNDSREVQGVLAASRAALIGNSWWAKFSGLVQKSLKIAERRTPENVDVLTTIADRLPSRFPAATGLNSSHVSTISGEEAAVQ